MLFKIEDMSSSLVVTPLTERCYLNLTVALGSFKCAGLLGPSMSGKRETVNLLAQVKF